MRERVSSSWPLTYEEYRRVYALLRARPAHHIPFILRAYNITCVEALEPALGHCYEEADMMAILRPFIANDPLLDELRTVLDIE